MKAIEQTSLILLSLSLLLLVIIGGAFALDRYVSSPPIFNTQSQDRNFSYVKSVRETTNLEGLRTVCLFWAEREDQFWKHSDAQDKKILLFIREGVTMIALLAIIFSAGSLYIYLSARRARRTNAL